MASSTLERRRTVGTGTAGRVVLTTALIYTRVSSDDQAREGVSLDAQLAECRRYAAQQGWVLGDEYQDVMTGKRDDRPRYQALLADVRDAHRLGTALTVVVAALDRFGRRLLERVRCREELKALGVPVHSVREGGEVSDLVANVLAAVAQEETRRLGERVSASLRHIGANGWHIAGPTPWGYAWRPATEEERSQGSPRIVLEMDERTAPIVREVFRRVATGDSLHSASRWVAALSDEERGGRLMRYNSVRRLFTTPTYEPKPSSRWPAIVDAATWRQAQQRIASHQHMPHQASGRFLLTGLIRCPRCGTRMRGNSNGPESRRKPNYVCSARDRGAGVPNVLCLSHAKAQLMDAAVLAKVGALVDGTADPALRSALQRAWNALQQPPATAEATRRIERLGTERDRARKRLADAAIKLVDGILDKAGYEAAKQRIETDLQAADRELGRLQEVKPVTALPPLAEVLAAAGNWGRALRETGVSAQRDVLAVLIDHILPIRVRRGEYDAQIVWTPLGDALRSAVGDLSERSA